MQTHGHSQSQTHEEIHGMKQVIEPKYHTDPSGTNFPAVVSIYTQTQTHDTV